MGSLSLPCRFLDAGDARLCYRDDGSGPALVLVHGWLLDSTIWTANVKAWAPRFRVLRLDRRGFGQSLAAPDLVADARDVVLLLDRLGIERAAILGPHLAHAGQDVDLLVQPSGSHRFHPAGEFLDVIDKLGLDEVGPGLGLLGEPVGAPLDGGGPRARPRRR